MNTKSIAMKDPKGCPFCGRIDRLRLCDDVTNGCGDTGVAVVCGDTCCIGPIRKTKLAAERAWQKRTRSD